MLYYYYKPYYYREVCCQFLIYHRRPSTVIVRAVQQNVYRGEAPDELLFWIFIYVHWNTNNRIYKQNKISFCKIHKSFVVIISPKQWCTYSKILELYFGHQQSAITFKNIYQSFLFTISIVMNIMHYKYFTVNNVYV